MTLPKPDPRNFGYEQPSIDSEGGWMIEGGEEAYTQALEDYIKEQKLKVERLIRPWGRTAERVSEEISTQVFDWNLPAPFETVPERPRLETVEERLREICDRNTQKSRKGMMNASWFRVVMNEEAKAVEVWHLNVSNPDRLFIRVY